MFHIIITAVDYQHLIIGGNTPWYWRLIPEVSSDGEPTEIFN